MCADARADAYTAWSGHAASVRTHTRRGRDTSMHECVYGSVATHGLVVMHVRITHGLNFMDDGIMWTNYTNSHMQLKVKVKQLKKEAMQLKIKGKQLKMEAMPLKLDACKGTWATMISKELHICSTFFFYSFFFPLIFFSLPFLGER